MKNTLKNTLESESSSSKPVKYSLIMIIALCILNCQGGINMDVLASTLPGMATALGVESNATAMVTSGFFYGMIIGHIVTSPFSDIFGRRKTIIIGDLILIFASFLGAFMTSLTAIVIARTLQGIAAACVMYNCRAVQADVGKGPKSQFVMSVIMASGSILGVLLPLVGQFANRNFGWQGAFFAMGILHLIGFIMYLIFVPETSGITQRSATPWADLGRNIRLSITTPAFLYLALAFGLSMCTWFCYTGAAAFSMQNQLGMSSDLYAIMSSVNILTMFVGSLVSSALSKKIPAVKILRVSIVLELIVGAAHAILFGTGHQTIYIAWALWACMPFCNGLVMPNMMSLALDNAGKAIGFGAAFLGLLQYLFSSIMTSIISSVKGGGNVGAVTGIIMVVTAVAAFLFLNLGNGLVKKSAAKE